MCAATFGSPFNFNTFHQRCLLYIAPDGINMTNTNSSIVYFMLYTIDVRKGRMHPFKLPLSI
jgi:hypothetical protein